MTEDDRAIAIILRHRRMRDFDALETELMEVFSKTRKEVDVLIWRLVKEGKLYARGEGARNTLEDPDGRSDPRAWFGKWA